MMMFKMNDWTPQTFRELRKRMNESREQFAERFRVCIGTIRDWEQGKAKIPGPARVLLDMMASAMPSDKKRPVAV